jgi:hypothetical protein
VEQREHGVGEREFLVDAVLGELEYAGVDVVRRRTRQVVVLHEHAPEIAARPGLAFHADHIRAVLVPDPRRRTFEFLGKPFVEDVVGHRDVVVGGEDLGALRESGQAFLHRMAFAELGCAETFRRIQR